MKNSIPSDVWEKKRALIAKLYKDEEWPLKQVIKQIRSEDFNPRYVFLPSPSAQCQPTNLSSETQLRSRLKKWRVTKPSRQTRKKSQETTADDSDPDDFSKDHSSTTSSSTQKSSSQPAATKALNHELDWHPVSLDEQDLSGVWVHHPHQTRDLSHSPSDLHQFPPSVVPSSSSYDPSQPSTPVDGVLLNPSSSMAPYSSPSYTVAPDVCLPQSTAPPSTTVTSVPWSIPPPWFPIPLDGVSPQAFYTTTAPSLGSPVAGSPEQSIPPPPGRIYSPHSMPYQGVLPHGAMPDFLSDAKPFRRTMSLQTDNVGSGNEAPKYFERKASMPAKTSNNNNNNNTPNAFDLVNFSNAQSPMMCAPIYPYPDQDPLMHKASTSIGF